MNITYLLKTYNDKDKDGNIITDAWEQLKVSFHSW
jgi:hypothetical protein